MTGTSICFCISYAAVSALDCGDLTSPEQDHAAIAKEYSLAGNKLCALEHRKRDSEIYDDVDANFNLAVSFEDLGQYNDAVRSWKRAHSLSPNDEDIISAHGQCIDKAKEETENRPCAVSKREDCDFDIINAKDLTMEIWGRDYLRRKPVLVTFDNGASDWTSPELWKFERLTHDYGDEDIMAGYSEILVKTHGQGYQSMKLADFVDKQILRANMSEEAMYMLEPGLFKRTDLPETLNLPEVITQSWFLSNTSINPHVCM
jgi:tetratricopeptide (TPR) repeat protein